MLLVEENSLEQTALTAMTAGGGTYLQCCKRFTVKVLESATQQTWLFLILNVQTV
jgi:hypothetical protein